MESLTWKKMWKKHLEHKYAEHAIRWENETRDDRLVFCILYMQMQEALDSLDDEPQTLVRSAVTSRFETIQKAMDCILDVFKER